MSFFFPCHPEHREGSEYINVDVFRFFTSFRMTRREEERHYIAKENAIRLPNRSTLFRSDVHRVGFGDAEGVVPRIDVWQSTVHTPTTK